MSTVQIMSPIHQYDKGGDGLHNVGFKSGGATTASVVGLSHRKVGKPGYRLFSEDALLVARNFNNGQAVDKNKAVAMVKEVRDDVRGRTVAIKGGATLSCVVTSDEGIAYCNIADGCIFAVGEKGIFPISMPQRLPDGRLGNGIGETLLEEDGYDGKNDQFGWLSREEIEKAVGGNAKIVIVSDGVVENPHKPPAPFDPSAGIPVYTQEEKERNNHLVQEEQLQRMQWVVGNAPEITAEWLVKTALAGRSGDDLSAIVFDIPPAGGQHVIAALSDAMSRGGSGEQLSRAAIKVVEEYAKEIARGFGITSIEQVKGEPIATVNINNDGQFRQGGIGNPG